jgi:hypothetical protein
MTVVDLARGRAVGVSQAPSSENHAISASRQPGRSRIAVEIGGTLLVLMLIALGVLALRFVLVLAHGVLG